MTSTKSDVLAAILEEEKNPVKLCIFIEAQGDRSLRTLYNKYNMS